MSVLLLAVSVALAEPPGYTDDWPIQTEEETPKVASNAEIAWALAVQRQLESAFVVPATVTGPLSCRVELTIDADGALTSWRLLASSGHLTFDEAVARVFAEVKTLPRHPERRQATLRTDMKLAAPLVVPSAPEPPTPAGPEPGAPPPTAPPPG